MARIPRPGLTARPLPPASHRLQRLDELTLGRHELKVRTSSSPDTAPTGLERVPHERLAAEGLYSRTATALGEKPVLAPVPAGGGRLNRPAQGVGAWRVREAYNQPFLQPGKAYTPQDFHDFQVDQRSPTIQAAVAELEAKVPNINGADPLSPELSTNATVLLMMLQSIERRGPFSQLSGGSTRNLASSGAVANTLMQFAMSAAEDNVCTAERLTSLDEAGELLLTALREAVPDQRGLQVVLHRAQLPIEPVTPDVPLTREEAAAALKVKPALLDQMVAEAPIPKSLPALDAAMALLPDDAFAGAHCVAVQHLLATNATMFAAMTQKGLDPHRTEIIGVPYSTNFVVEHALRQRGFSVNTPDVVDPSEVGSAYEAAIGPAVKRALDQALSDGKPVLLIDDGGKLSTYVAKHFPEHARLFHVVEQTTRGLTELAALPSVPMPVVNVAKSPLKQFEMPFIGQQAVQACEALASQIGLGGVTRKAAVVLGYGPIGQGIARALKAQGAPVTVWDPDPKAREQARRGGFEVPESREQALQNKALAVGASGHRSLSREDLQLLQHECVVASASSRDIEVDLTPNHDEKVEVVPLLAAGRGDRRFVTRVWRFPDRDVVVLRNGFPINFSGSFETGSDDEIAPTRAAMLLGAAQALRESAPGLHAANVEQQRQVAKALGRELPT